MQITLYLRSYPVVDAPVAVSFAPDPPAQLHTFSAGGRVYEAERREVRVFVPDNAKLDPTRNLLAWAGDNGHAKSTAKEVHDLAKAGASGFRVAR